MFRSLTAMLFAILGLSLSDVFAQDVSQDRSETQMMPESPQEQLGQPARLPEAQLNAAYFVAIAKCLEQTGPEQEQCIAETKERFGRM